MSTMDKKKKKEGDAVDNRIHVTTDLLLQAARFEDDLEASVGSESNFDPKDIAAAQKGRLDKMDKIASVEHKVVVPATTRVEGNANFDVFSLKAGQPGSPEASGTKKPTETALVSVTDEKEKTSGEEKNKLPKIPITTNLQLAGTYEKGLSATVVSSSGLAPKDMPAARTDLLKAMDKIASVNHKVVVPKGTVVKGTADFSVFSLRVRKPRVAQPSSQKKPTETEDDGTDDRLTPGNG